MTASQIHESLRKLFPHPQYAYIPEFRAGTGFSKYSERYLDAFVMACFPSDGLVRIGIEIKISKADFNREMRNKYKRDSALRICNQFYFAAPKGLISPDNIPEAFGLIEVDEMLPAEFTAEFALDAPHFELPPAPLPFIASLARRAHQYL